MRLRLSLLIGIWLGAIPAAAIAQPADLVLRGGNVITVDKDWRIAQAVIFTFTWCRMRPARRSRR